MIVMIKSAVKPNEEARTEKCTTRTQRATITKTSCQNNS